MLRAACHSRDEGWKEVRDLERVSDLRQEAGNLLWAREDVRELSAEDIELIQKEFDLPPSAVEAAVSARARPKIEPFDDDIFAVVHELDEEDGQLEAVQIAAFVGNDFVLVLHAGADRTLERAEQALKGLKDIEGPLRLLYLLFDVIVADYQEIADDLEDEVEAMEEIVLAAPDAPVQRQLYSLKQRLARLRRYVLPWSRLMEETVDAEVDSPHSVERLHTLRGLRDRLLRIRDQVGNIDELTQAVIDLTQSEQSQRLNENSRKLAAWAAIFAVATVIGGIYGMNFRLVPRDHTLFGFWFALGLIFVSCSALFWYFKRRKWL